MRFCRFDYIDMVGDHRPVKNPSDRLLRPAVGCAGDWCVYWDAGMFPHLIMGFNRSARALCEDPFFTAGGEPV